jgi:hypothetical protein
MKKILLGMGLQAACVAVLVAFGVIEVTARQQAVTAVIFFMFALLINKNKAG